MDVVFGQRLGIDQQPLFSIDAVAHIEFGIVCARISLQIKELPAPHLGQAHPGAGFVERGHPLQQLVASGNTGEYRARVVILRFHPRGNFRVGRLLQPAIRVSDLGAKIFLAHFADRRLRQFCLRKADCGHE